jgi:hypothetical protein
MQREHGIVPDIGAGRRGCKRESITPRFLEKSKLKKKR